MVMETQYRVLPGFSFELKPDDGNEAHVLWNLTLHFLTHFICGSVTPVTVKTRLGHRIAQTAGAFAAAGEPAVLDSIDHEVDRRFDECFAYATVQGWLVPQ